MPVVAAQVTGAGALSLHLNTRRAILPASACAERAHAVWARVMERMWSRMAVRESLHARCGPTALPNAGRRVLA